MELDESPVPVQPVRAIRRHPSEHDLYVQFCWFESREALLTILILQSMLYLDGANQ